MALRGTPLLPRLREIVRDGISFRDGSLSSAHVKRLGNAPADDNTTTAATHRVTVVVTVKRPAHRPQRVSNMSAWPEHSPTTRNARPKSS